MAKTIFEMLIDELREHLQNISVNTVPIHKFSGDIYSLYVFSCVVQSARSKRAKISYHSPNGATSSTFICRNKPGNIYSHTHEYTHAIIETQSRNLYELHMGVKAKGLSGIAHECDISLLSQITATQCRINNSNPYHNDIQVFIECKYRHSYLNLDIGRSFIGLALDFCNAQRGILASNIHSLSIWDLIDYHRKPNKRFYYFPKVIPVGRDNNLRNFYSFISSVF